MEPIRPGVYRHFKGNLYRLLFTAQHSEPLEKVVVSRPLHAPHGYGARPPAMWQETEKRDGYTGPLFKWVEP